MSCSPNRFLVVSALVALTFLSPAVARGAFVGSAISIQVQSANGVGQYDLTLPIPTDPWAWESDQPLNIYSASQPDQLLATIDSIGVQLDGDPAVALNFAVTAGSSAALISIVSSTVTFDPLLNADAFATASLTLTDNNGNGAYANGLLGGKSYEARFNGGTLFAGLLTPLMVGANATNTASDRFPVAGTQIIPGLTSSIQSQFSFLLSPRDSASGTSRFQVNIPTNNVPEPSTYVLAMLGMAGAWLIRRRKGR
jgi:hypothetical protein